MKGHQASIRQAALERVPEFDAASTVCSGLCPTPNSRNGLPCGECPVCGSFWMPTWNGTAVRYARISREDYQRWLAESGYGVQPDGRTVPLPGVAKLPNTLVVLPT